MVTKLSLLLFCAWLLQLTKAQNQPKVAAPIKSEDTAQDFLAKYGYYDKFSPNTPAEELKVSLKRMQKFAGLAVTGNLDAATIKQMNTPRCGLADPIIKVTRRRKRYVLQGTTWKSTGDGPITLTWYLSNAGRTLTKDKVENVLRKAFKIWEGVTNLKFVEQKTEKDVDIFIKFAEYDHGDFYPFDGQGGTLAHAFYPHNNKGFAGDVHFDDAEEFTIGVKYGRNLLWVATHELGHSLGLDHSNVRSALMFPWYTGYRPDFNLNIDDIQGIQALYGSKIVQPETTTTPKATTTTTAKTTTTTTTKKPTTTKATTRSYVKKCPKSAVTLHHYNSYARLEVVVTENQHIRFIEKNKGIQYGPFKAKYYIPIRTPKLKHTATLSTKDLFGDGEEYTIWFLDNTYDIYQHFRYISGKHSIYDSSGPLGVAFPRWVKRIDAAMQWHRNGKVYFFHDVNYWRYNLKTKELEGVKDRIYPKLITRGFRGLPGKINSAYSSDTEKTTFFTIGEKLYKLNDYYVRVESGYPEHVGENWLKCGNSDEWKTVKKVSRLTAEDGVQADDP